MSLQRNQTIGFLGEGNNEGTEVIVADTDYWEFGYYANSWGSYPEMVQKIKENWKGGNYEAFELIMNSYHVLGAVLYIPSNAMMLYHLLGDASTVAGTTLIQTIGIGDTETFNVRYNSDNETQYIRDTVLGARCIQIAGSIELADKGLALSEQATFLGRDIINSVVTTKVDPKFPDGNSADAQLEYIKDGNFSVLWDGEEIGAELLSLGYIFTNFNIPVNIQGQNKPKRITNSDIIYIFNLKMKRSAINSLYTDFLAQKDGLVYKDMVIDIYCSATLLREYLPTDCVIRKCVLNDASLQDGETPYFDVQIQARSLVIASVDGLANTFYGSN